MKKIYILKNIKTDYIYYASEDKSFLEELMLDQFIEDVEWGYMLLYKNPYLPENSIKDTINLCWNKVLKDYKNNINIIEVEVI